MEQNFPLRSSFFRGPPLDTDTRHRLTKDARENSESLVRMAFSEKWRHIPQEKDGAQFCKDTSNMGASFRLVRAAVTLKSSEHELRKLFLHTNTENLRSFVKKLAPKNYVDAMVLHTVLNDDSTTTDNNNENSLVDSTLLSSQYKEALEYIHNNTKILQPEYLMKLSALASLVNNNASPIFKPSTDEQQQQLEEVISSTMEEHGRASVKTVQTQFLHTLSQIHPDWTSVSVFTNPVAQTSGESVSVKWGVLDAQTSSSGSIINNASRRDFCIVDHLTSTSLPSSSSEEIGVWSCKSVDGHRVGCMGLQDSHGVSRTAISKFGLVWRKTSAHQASAKGAEELEVVICGSVVSKHARSVMTSMLTALTGRLQDLVEDLRISCCTFVPRSSWVSDADRNGCKLCMRNFKQWRRKHHCRMCGEVVCSDCSIIRNVTLPVVGTSKLRMCKVCLTNAKNTPVKISKSVKKKTKTIVVSSSSHPVEHYSSEEEEYYTKRKNSRIIVDNQEQQQRASFCIPSTKTNAPLDMEKQRLLLRNAGPEPRHMFERLCRMACEALGCPLASVSVMHHQHDVIESSRVKIDSKAKFSNVLDESSASQELRAFASRAMTGKSPLVVLDASIDARVGEKLRNDTAPQIRFFAGCPVEATDGSFGYICVADVNARKSLSRDAVHAMERLATLSVVAMEDRKQDLLPEENNTSFYRKSEIINTSTYSLPDAASASQTPPSASSIPVNTSSPMAQAEAKMRSLLMKSYQTQQSIANVNDNNKYM